MKTYSITPPDTSSNGIIYNSPHSGRYLPEEFVNRFDGQPIKLHQSGDSRMDEVISGTTSAGSHLFKNLYGRIYVDTNRDVRELDPHCLKDSPRSIKFIKSEKVVRGFGVIPMRTFDGQDIYPEKSLSYETARARLDQVYQPVHAALGELLDKARSDHGYYLLVDCHSMPSYKFINSRLQASNQADVVIGNNFDKSCYPNISRFVADHFEAEGLAVRFNAPYAGGYNTVHYGQPNYHKHAIQIELNRSLYLNEEDLTLHQGFEELKDSMTSLSRKLDCEIRNLL
ncbi:N-formylglutamate amidohydrolase [Emcibacter sp.]|uniref:N-formylglutamate amidohydrolase n=1 Tax=Emcibacter sp. TaxID=1979954 RepID=UPI002AA6BF54|nr:N-formylglutamate amidohydrolase [Emcibacter sp.]